MAMGPPTIIGIAITGVNSVLLAALAIVWFRNYQQFRSTMVLGMRILELIALSVLAYVTLK
ncbi:MAG: hypothetical protein ACI8TL_001368 [Natronomonas sp.]|jgi:hypothetical protein